MGMYQIEQQHVEQEAVWQDIRRYVERHALAQPLHEVEKELFRLLLALGLSLLREVVARHGTGRAGVELSTGDGPALPYHGLKSRQYLSIFGPLEIIRAYYWRHGQLGRCPMDATLNLPARRYSYLLDQWVQAGVIQAPYDEAIGRLGELLGLCLWKRGQEQVAQEVATHVRAFYQEKTPPTPATEGPVLCATADCKGVRMVPSEKPAAAPAVKGPKARRGKGDKRAGLRRDAVATADFSFVPAARTPAEMVELLMRTRSDQDRQAARAERHQRRERGEPEPRQALHKHVSACMYGKTRAFADLADRLARRDPEGRKPIFVLLDGDPALEHRLMEEFLRRDWSHRLAGVCLDIMHTMEYVWEAATALYGEKSPQREPWVRTQALALLEGRVGRVIGALRQIVTKRAKQLRTSQHKTLHKVIGYFENHRHMMRYDVYLGHGYPIATGVIEGTCGSLVKDRTDGSGMRWTRGGAQAVLDLRAVRKNGDWDAFWMYHIEREYRRLYGGMAA